jgi:hypothetical protein
MLLSIIVFVDYYRTRIKQGHNPRGKLKSLYFIGESPGLLLEKILPAVQITGAGSSLLSS